MTEAELTKLIEEGENISTEFKECTNSLPKNIFETVCSFLNRFGGHIFLGVRNDGTVVGVDKDKVKDIKADFISLLNNPQKISPTVYLNIDEMKYKDKTILHAYVPESSQVHNTKGRIFDRNEDGDFDISDNTSLVAKLYIRKQREYTENIVFPYARMSDLREDLIERVRLMATNRRPNHPWARLNNEELLRSSGLYKRDLETGEKGFTLACILLFGTNEAISSVLPYHRTDAIYRMENLDRYDDRDDIRSNLIESYDRLMNFIEKHIDDKFYMEGEVRVSARNKLFREIIANMLIHREYSNAYPAKLVIEKNEVITENGNKARGMGPIKLTSFTPYPKNPTIASVFKEIGWAEELGSGIVNIVKYNKVYSKIPPKFIDGDVFKTVISLNDLSSKENEPVNELVNGPVNEPVNFTRLNMMIRELIKENSRICLNEIAEKTNKSRSTVKRSIKFLKDNGYIERVGSDKKGCWVVLK